MISVTTKLRGFNPNGIKANLPMTLGRYQMEQLGKTAITALRQRSDRGQGSNDAPFPPLSQKYSAVKVKGKFVRQRDPYSAWKARHGLQPIRDLVGTGKDGGHMWDNFTVRMASEDTVRMAFTSRKARAKAISNERRTPFLSLDGSVEKAVLAQAKKFYGEQVDVFRRSLAANFERAA